MCVNHRKEILHVSHGFYGSCNDKTIFANDIFSKEIKVGKYKDITYYLYDIHGNYIKTNTQAAYVIMPEPYRMAGINAQRRRVHIWNP